MAHANQPSEVSAQTRVARKYKRLGYEVEQNPRPNALPDFLSDVTPDIVARSDSDNVIIEVKRHSSLKGSNDLVKLAERVSAHPDWRLELVVPDDARDQSSRGHDQSFQRLTEKIDFAISLKLYDLAYVYLIGVLIGIAHDLALANNLKARNISDKAIFMDLGFKGLLPENLLQSCLKALDARNEFIRLDADAEGASEGEVRRLIELCEQLNELL